jgi:hypothetical protein
MKKIEVIRSISALILVSLLSGCGGSHWVRNDSSYIADRSGASVDIPVEWIQHKNAVLYDGLYFSKEGPEIHQIYIYRIWDKDLKKVIGAFPAEYMLMDWANIYLEYTFDNNSYEQLSLAPALIGQDKIPSFRLSIRVPGSKRIPYQRVVYGFKKDEFLYILSYNALELYFFDRDLEVFEKTVNSYQLH